MEYALRFYAGDVSWWNGPPSERAFWTDSKAYGTLNAFFFEGLANERARIAEHKPLNAAFLEDSDRLLNLCGQIIGAMRASARPDARFHTFRVERLANFQEMKQAGRTIAFTSTSKAGFLDDYKGKKQLVLLDFYIGPNVPHADLQRILPQYLKSEEQEVLLPPFLPLCFTPRPLTSEEEKIQDYDGQAPVAAFEVTVGAPVPSTQPVLPLPPAGAAAGQRVLRSLAGHRAPDETDAALYCAWKKAFRSQVRHHCGL